MFYFFLVSVLCFGFYQVVISVDFDLENFFSIKRVIVNIGVIGGVLMCFVFSRMNDEIGIFIVKVFIVFNVVQDRYIIGGFQVVFVF